MMPSSLKLHTRTQGHIASAMNRPGQGYLLIGTGGSGKFELAQRMAKAWAANDTGLVHVLQPDGDSIGIEAIHKLRPFFGQKVAEKTRRSLIIDQSHLLTREAQNSLLKALEEPPPRTTFILTCLQPADLLPTVVSRLQPIRLHPIPEADLTDWYSQAYKVSPQEARRLYYVGGRTPGGMINASSHDDPNSRLAKDFLASDHYQRILIISKLQKTEKAELTNFINRLLQIFELTLVRSARQAEADTAKSIARRMNLLLDCALSLEQNANPRLVLSRLVLEL